MISRVSCVLVLLIDVYRLHHPVQNVLRGVRMHDLAHIGLRLRVVEVHLVLNRVPVPDLDHVLAGGELDRHEYRHLDQEAHQVRDGVDLHAPSLHNAQIVRIQQLLSGHGELALYAV